VSRRKHPDQFDLFACSMVVTDHGVSDTGRPAAAPSPRARPVRPVAQMPTDALLDLMTLHLYGEPPAEPGLVPLIEECGRRRERAAVPLLLRTCRRFAGHDRMAPAAELRAALAALAETGATEAGHELVDLVEQGAFGASGTVAALLCLAGLRCRRAADLVRSHAAHPDPAIRQAACQLAGALGRAEDLDAVLPLAADADRQVARTACLTLGRLGHRAVKAELEALLVRATPVDLPGVVDALVRIADDDTAVVLGRVAERSDEAGRRAVVNALGEIDTPGAAVWLARLARDPKPSVRLGVVAALARREPGPAVLRALGDLARDGDAAVRAAAEEALKAADDGW
jgi:hypothetical protein